MNTTCFAPVLRTGTSAKERIAGNMILRAVVLVLPLFFFMPFSVCRAQVTDAQIRASVPSLDELAGNWMQAAQLLALPAINSMLGSAEAAPDLLSIGNLSFPPLTMNGGTGDLLVNGEKPRSLQCRWYPYQVARRGFVGDFQIGTEVRMLFDKRGLLFHIYVTNRGTKAGKADVQINLSARTSTHQRWGWKVPRDGAEGFKSAVSDGGRSLLLRDPVQGRANCYGFAIRPSSLVSRGDSGLATWHVSLQPRDTFVINYVLVFDGADGDARQIAGKWAADFNGMFDDVKRAWQKRFDAMFIPGNGFFSGYLPVLITPDAKLRRMYYMSLVSILSVLRTGFPVAPRVYVSNTPQSNCTMMYFWDTSEWAVTLALLDPAMLKQYLEAWLSKGIYNGYAEEYLTGTLQGPWYSANDLSVFRLVNAYLDVTGDRSFLSEKIKGKTVLEYLDGMAVHWKSLVRPGRTLADYGGAANLLECVPTYIHEVASLNAVNVNMMQRVSQMQAVAGNARRAGELQADAGSLASAVLGLYVPGQGVWNARHRDGSEVEIRHVFDYATIGLAMKDRLSPEMHRDMTDFVMRELVTGKWMRAQSLSDAAASVSLRPDHGPMGAYCAWPAETMRVMCGFGDYRQALDFLHDCTGVTLEGPFSQSRALMSRDYEAKVRIAPAPQTYNASNGGAFAETIIRGFFGYEPDFLTGAVVPDTAARSFSGRLLNVRNGQRIFNLISEAQGIRVKRIE